RENPCHSHRMSKSENHGTRNAAQKCPALVVHHSARALMICLFPYIRMGGPVFVHHGLCALSHISDSLRLTRARVTLDRTDWKPVAVQNLNRIGDERCRCVSTNNRWNRS